MNQVAKFNIRSCAVLPSSAQPSGGPGAPGGADGSGAPEYDPADAERVQAANVRFAEAFTNVSIRFGAVVAAAVECRREGIDRVMWLEAIEGLGQAHLILVKHLTMEEHAIFSFPFPPPPPPEDGGPRESGNLDHDRLLESVNKTTPLYKWSRDELQQPENNDRLEGMGGQTRMTWEVNMADIGLVRQIGTGSFGVVYEGKWKSLKVAVKLFRERVMMHESEALLQAVKEEAALMSNLRHPNIVLFMCVSTRPPDLAIISEYCELGSLASVIEKTAGRPEQLPWSRRLSMMRDAALGMVYLHTSRPVIIHHDLTPSNLLVNRHWQVKVGDFGVSRIITDKIVAGTDASRKNPICMAPEVLQQNPYGTASDVFSFGCCLWCICTLREPWGEIERGNRALMVLKAVVDEGKRLEFPEAGAVVPAYEDLGAYAQISRDCFLCVRSRLRVASLPSCCLLRSRPCLMGRARHLSPEPPQRWIQPSLVCPVAGRSRTRDRGWRRC